MTMIFELLLLTGGGLFTPPVLPVPEAIARETAAPLVADDYGDLEAAYQKAHDEWRSALRAAKDAAAKKELRANHPVRAHWQRFADMAEAGEGRALIWMSENLRDRGLKLSEIDGEHTRILEALLGHRQAAWFEAGIQRLKRGRKAMGDEWLVRALRLVAKDSEVRAVRASALFELMQLLQESGSEEGEAEARSLVETLTKEYGDTSYGMQARAASIRPEDLEPGKVAPDFIGKTIDGHEFKLSDYRGKVVLVDFYGFW